MPAQELLKTVLFNNPNLKAYYRFESGSLTTDSSGNSNTLTNNNTVGESTGVYGGAATLGTSNTNKSLSIASSLGIDITASYSFSLWLKVNTQPASGVYQRLLELYSTTTAQSYSILWYLNDAGTYKVSFNSRSGTNAVHSIDLGTSNWNHIACVCSAGTLYLYINGAKVGTTGTRGTDTINANSFYIGSKADGSEDSSVQYDDLAVFASALSADQVKELYEGRIVGELWPQAGLVAGYHLNGSSTDFSGNNFHLTDTAVTYAQANGKFGQGGSYNGSSSKSLLNSALGITGNISLSLWIQQNAEIGSGSQTYILTYNKTNGRQYSIGYGYNSGTRRLTFAADKVDVEVVNATFNITLGTTNWYHAVLTYDGSTLKAYLNGNLVNSTASTGNGSLVYNACFRIGCETNVGTLSDSGFANAKLDEVLVFNRALTAQEIRRMYALGRGMYV